MKFLRLILGLFVILFFFVLGIGVADKEYLSKNVVGIHIYADDKQSINTVCDLLARTQCSDTEEIFRLLQSHEIFAYLSPDKEYFNVNNCVMGHFPYAAYDTIIIDIGEYDQIEATCLKQLGNGPCSFQCARGLFATKVQEYYVSFLSYIGKIQKFASESSFKLLKLNIQEDIYAYDTAMYRLGRRKEICP